MLLWVSTEGLPGRRPPILARLLLPSLPSFHPFPLFLRPSLTRFSLSTLSHFLSALVTSPLLPCAYLTTRFTHNSSSLSCLFFSPLLDLLFTFPFRLFTLPSSPTHPSAADVESTRSPQPTLDFFLSFFPLGSCDALYIVRRRAVPGRFPSPDLATKQRP